MIALVDCNSFFCSVEKVFNPGLEGKPVCVLSSNDGCIVALTPEAKAVGLKRGDPLFKVKDIVDRNGVVVFSGNMQLYAAMSKRVTNILRQSVACVENYSIDESFCYLDGYEKHYDLTEMMRGIARKIKLWTDIPVSVGIGPTKTLAKIGSKFAKNYKGYDGVCTIDTEEKRRKALSLFALADVWGIGRSTLAKLEYYGIHTPLEFADRSKSWVTAHFNKPALQTWMELNGTPCIDTTEIHNRKSICTSRSFGEMITDRAGLKAAVAGFASSCANKLRAQHSVAGEVTVFICSNRFREDLPQYSSALTGCFETSTSDTMEITEMSMKLLDSMFVDGIHYKKAGVILTSISAATAVEQNLFDRIENRAERMKLMKAIDNLNHRYGVKTLRLAVEGEAKPLTKSEFRSPNYLTDIDEILGVKE